jgi:hypothetical protein
MDANVMRFIHMNVHSLFVMNLYLTHIYTRKGYFGIFLNHTPLVPSVYKSQARSSGKVRN